MHFGKAVLTLIFLHITPVRKGVMSGNINKQIPEPKVGFCADWVMSQLCQLAKNYVPVDTNPTALADQWLHSIACNGNIFCSKDQSSMPLLEAQIEYILEQQFGIKKKALYKHIFQEVNFPPPQKPKFKFVDLFAGIGGIRLAAQGNGGACVFSSEFDSYAQSTYKLNFGELPFGDITKIHESAIPDHDVLFAGFPCQPFSYSGQCEGFQDKTRGTLFFDVLRIIKEKKTKLVLLENVKGFKSHAQGKTMNIALAALRDAGYTTHWAILNSFDFGVPQYRERWYCVAVSNESKFEFPKGEGRHSKLRDIVDLNTNDPSLSIPQFEAERINYHLEHEKDQVRVQHDNSKYGSNTKKGKHGVFSFTKPDGSIRFHVGDYAKTQIQEAFYACLDTYAPTIIANRVPKLWDIGRKLSVRESLRLQGFPEGFDFNVSNVQAYKQLGNSVTVSVVDRILKQILEQKIL